MAVKAYDDNSGHGPESASTTDLSHLTGNVFAGQSMNAGNTLTPKPLFGGNPVVSEGTADAGPYDAEHDVADVFSTPAVDTSNNRVSG